jgi:hypothetical protein
MNLYHIYHETVRKSPHGGRDRASFHAIDCKYISLTVINPGYSGFPQKEKVDVFEI